uniref:Bet v I/Major latex protein domain-containing protein n=1 Tax=Manihot esculenta TaxID=3983 RepID=A0A2C9U680_MANES
MTLWGKLEVHFWIDAHADQFHDVFSCQPHHISNMSPHKIQGCDLDEDGSAKVAKDDVNLLTVFKVIEGDLLKCEFVNRFQMIEADLLKEYKSFKLTVQATPKGEGSVARWTLEYEKIHENIRDPYFLL